MSAGASPAFDGAPAGDSHSSDEDGEAPSATHEGACAPHSVPHHHLQRHIAAFGELMHAIFPLNLIDEITAAVPARAKIICEWLADLHLRDGEQIAMIAPTWVAASTTFQTWAINRR